MTNIPFPRAQRLTTGSPALKAARSPGRTHSDSDKLAFARGDVNSRDRLVRSNLGLVVKIAKSYLGNGLDADDLIAEGNIGLIRAATDFDPTFNVRFSTYATYWIKMAIRRGLTRTSASIRLPSNMVSQLSKWRKTERELACELGHQPTSEQIAASLGLTESQRENVSKALRSRRLSHESTNDENRLASHASEPVLTVEAEIEHSEELRFLRNKMERRLDERERRVISLRFGLDGEEPLTPKEIGRKIGISRAWARKIEIRAISRLREAN
jgi:RNA polymerase sigma factor (sigma-70 family)